MQRHFHKLLLSVFAFSSLLILDSCAEQANSNAPVVLPTVVVNCTSNNCKRNLIVKVYVYFTASSCDPNFVNWAAASSSFTLNCTFSTGCYGSPTSWVDARGSITTIPSGTYSLCGRVDYDNNYPTVTTNDTTAFSENVSIGATTSPVSLVNWTDN